MIKRYIAPTFFVVLIIAVIVAVVASSLDFQQCVKTDSENDPSAQHSENSVAAFVHSIPTYRHCVGAYVIDKNSAITALGTAIIAIFTTILGIFTVSLARSTRVAANAADLSARAAIAIDLPIIKATPVKLDKGFTVKDGIETDILSVSFVTFSNLGRTKAFPIRLRYGFAVGKLPKKPKYTFVDLFQFNDIIDADPKITTEKFLSGSFRIDSGIWSKVCGGGLSVWFFCELVYYDFMQDHERAAAFCWRWQNIGMGMGWRDDDTPAYNR